MGVAFYPVFENEMADVDLSFCGKMLAKIVDKAGDLRCEELGVSSLMSFFGYDPAMLEDFDIDPGGILETKWFDAVEGVKTVDALLKDIPENENLYFPGELVAKFAPHLKPGVIEDLELLRTLLNEAKSRSIRWHLAIF